MKRLLVPALALALMAGCAANTTFVYKPNAPAAGVQKLPFKVAVLPFKDGTEDFTKRGSVLARSHYYNLAKTGIPEYLSALTPDLWAKASADDMAASGAFRAARFIYSPSELVDEDIYIEGTLEKATYAGTWSNPNEFAFGLRAFRRADKKPIWEKEVSRTWNYAEDLYKGCGGMAVQCRADRHHADTNRVMREMFAEARGDLVATLAGLSGSRAGGEGGLPSAASPGEALQDKRASSPPVPESTEQTIDRILRDK